MSSSHAFRITVIEKHIAALKSELSKAESLKLQSYEDPQFMSRHTMDRTRVEFIEISIKRTEAELKAAQAILELDKLSKEVDKFRLAYLSESERWEERNTK